jgi:putative transposase
MQRITNKRTRKIDHSLHTASRRLVDLLVGEQVGMYMGKRIRRGMFRSAKGYRYNADVNGFYNILRKVAPDAFAQGSRGCVVHPSSLLASR